MITDNIIRLRPLEEKDSLLLYSWRKNFENTRLTQGIRFPKHFLLEKDWVINVSKDTSNKSIFFMIEVIETGESIGYLQLTSINWVSRTCNYGIVITSKEDRRKGYADHAMVLIIKYAFNSLNLRKITSEILSSNIATIRYVEKHNFIQEGLLKEHYYWGGKYEDISIYSLLSNNKE